MTRIKMENYGENTWGESDVGCQKTFNENKKAEKESWKSSRGNVGFIYPASLV